MGLRLKQIQITRPLLVILRSEVIFSHLRTPAGTVTKKKVAGQLHIYPYDRRLFHPGVSCPTCQLVKPARSKHCSEYLLYIPLQNILLELYQCWFISFSGISGIIHTGVSYSSTTHWNKQNRTVLSLFVFQGSATGVSNVLTTIVSGWTTASVLRTHVTSCFTSSACAPWRATSPC